MNESDESREGYVYRPPKTPFVLTTARPRRPRPDSDESDSLESSEESLEVLRVTSPRPRYIPPKPQSSEESLETPPSPTPRTRYVAPESSEESREGGYQYTPPQTPLNFPVQESTEAPGTLYTAPEPQESKESQEGYVYNAPSVPFPFPHIEANTIAANEIKILLYIIAAGPIHAHTPINHHAHSPRPIPTVGHIKGRCDRLGTPFTILAPYSGQDEGRVASWTLLLLAAAVSSTAANSPRVKSPGTLPALVTYETPLRHRPPNTHRPEPDRRTPLLHDPAQEDQRHQGPPRETHKSQRNSTLVHKGYPFPTQKVQSSDLLRNSHVLEPVFTAQNPTHTFDYSVKDDDSGNDFGHQESRDGHDTQGSYYVRSDPIPVADLQATYLLTAKPRSTYLPTKGPKPTDLPTARPQPPYLSRTKSRRTYQTTKKPQTTYLNAEELQTTYNNTRKPQATYLHTGKPQTTYLPQSTHRPQTNPKPGLTPLPKFNKNPETTYEILLSDRPIENPPYVPATTYRPVVPYKPKQVYS
nr:adhesive plaque matrix protein-like [Penaeus vannamei]